MKLNSSILKFCSAILLLGLLVWFVAVNSTLFLDSRLDRLMENGLPTITIEDEKIVYCRMKGDDFRLPLPPEGTVSESSIESGGYDTVAGSVLVTFLGGQSISPQKYEKWLKGKVQTGGWVAATTDRKSGGILVSFSYFGDK